MKSSHAVKALVHCRDKKKPKMFCAKIVPLGQERCPVLVTQDVLQHPWAQLGFLLLPSRVGTWGQASLESHQCLCYCMNVLNMLSSQRTMYSCRATRCLSVVQNVCAKRFAHFLLAKVSSILLLPTLPPKLLLWGQFTPFRMGSSGLSRGL